MSKALDTIRVNIRIHKDLHEYYKKKSEGTGIPMSFLMSMDLLEKAKQDQTLERMPDLMKVAQEMGIVKE